MKLPNGLPVLNALRAHGSPMSRSALAAAIGGEMKNLPATLRSLVAAGLVCEVARVPPRGNYAPLADLTDAGKAAADAGALPEMPRAPRPAKVKPAPVLAVVARVRECFNDPPAIVVVPVKPKGPDPRLSHRAPVPDPPKREEAAPVSGVHAAAPPSLAKRGGIQHPPMPQPAQRPAWMSKERWSRESVPVPSYLHDACARGAA